MSKQDGAAGHEKKQPEQKDHAPKPQGAPSAGGGGKSNVGAKVGCHATGCKDKDVRANFCDEHFRQFKFGLITKTGDRVIDYERKAEHYQKWLKAQKVA